MSRLQEKYKKEIIPALSEKFKYKNINMVPRLEKIIVNCCTRDCITNGKVVNFILDDIASITGQKAVKVKARKSVSTFKLREGQVIGAAATLRGERMFEFLDRLISISLPRVRDFQGVSSSAFDGRGNYTLGLKEQILFPEIDYDKIDKVRGMGISFVTTAKNNDEGRELLKLFGMPFKRQ